MITHPGVLEASGPGLDVEALATERLEAEITTLAGHIAAATCRWLLLVAEFDRREAWAGWGCKSCAHWLSWQCAMGLRAAREHVRVARALMQLPQIREEFAHGRLSYSQARALTRVAEPQRERELVELARRATAAQLERLVRGYLSATTLREQARDSYEARELVWWHDEDGSLVIQARLPAEDGAVVLEALQATADRLRDDGRECSAEPPPSEQATVPASRPQSRPLMADALIELARAGQTPSDRFRVVVNVDLDTLVADAPGTCRLTCGTVLAPETARRLACDQQISPVHHTDGRPRTTAPATRFASQRLKPGARGWLHHRGEPVRRADLPQPNGPQPR